ncbi:MAG: hypothetical protein LZF62_480249 [Nitrospira sp.]|nr:MAG: hypothetical protein LZF62_480249 [Nitrospira sp.]
MSASEPTSWPHRCVRKALMLGGVTGLLAQRCRRAACQQSGHPGYQTGGCVERKVIII